MSGTAPGNRPVEVLLLAIPETAGSALYGLFDVLSATGSVWQELTREPVARRAFRPRIVAPSAGLFEVGHGIPVQPHLSIDDDPRADVVIVPEIWLGPDTSISGRYPDIVDWLRRCWRRGSNLCSACSGAILLAETGLLNGCEATSHWGYQDLFRRDYPKVRFRPEPNLAFADPAGRVVTAGGTTSWHDLALYLVARYAGPAEARRLAKVYLLKWHDEGQLPWTPLLRRSPHNDALVRRAQDWLQRHQREDGAIGRLAESLGIAERTLGRRFRAALGCSPQAYLQDLRIEAAKRLLEESGSSVEAISAEVGYEDASYFRRLFRRRVGIGPADYRRMFKLPGA
ncbi:GlxA family transcriptional regulator [Arenimonas fontis]|uniref:Helix-turn-helix domain-containing protein n=1 Tax=Arenimonas fontis TaxID=2608255 RepID=A0A5B2ZDU1_9GAMM|nr:helix-turn-helix domain-containing protein [Arenimonas fontis]KAA2286296.1 helix-turn-helix domain-containing protein [Arenimonas fontis]